MLVCVCVSVCERERERERGRERVYDFLSVSKFVRKKELTKIANYDIRRHIHKQWSSIITHHASQISSPSYTYTCFSYFTHPQKSERNLQISRNCHFSSSGHYRMPQELGWTGSTGF